MHLIMPACWGNPVVSEWQLMILIICKTERLYSSLILKEQKDLSFDILLGGVKMSTENSNQIVKKGGKKAVIGIIILVAIILALAGVIVYLLLSRAPEEEKERRNVVVTPDNVEEVIQDMAKEEFVAPGYYTVTMNYEWTFQTGDAVSSNAYVENRMENTNAVYLDLFLVGDEENAIYESPIIPVGSSLQDIALGTPLDAGTYDCVAVYHLVDDDENTISTLRVNVTVIVEG